jgi:RNA-directed DNA polymerase
MVAGTASPDDPSLTDYWAQRRHRNPPPMGTTTLRLLRVQHGRCPLCRGLLLHADREPQSPLEWEQWLTATCKAIRKNAVIVWAVARQTNASQSVSYPHTASADTGNGNGHSTSDCL